MGKFCLYADRCSEAPCVINKMRKYSYLSDFLRNLPSGSERRYSVPMTIECLKPISNTFEVQEPKCINCMFCVFGCIGNRILISKNIHPIEFCVDITRDQIDELKNEFLPKLFKGSFINIPKVPLSHLKVKYPSFESFTTTKETENIAVWGANAMRYLSTSLEPRISLEVGLIIQDRDRGGRLDISLFNSKDNYLFVAETKVSFNSMMSEGRYETQMIAYEAELERTCPSEIKRAKFLLIGDKESDLLPPTHPDCTGGKQSMLFYDVCRKQKFFFISANALLALGLMKLYVSMQTYSLENLYKIMIDHNYIGLLSSGVVKTSGEIISFDAIPGFIVN